MIGSKMSRNIYSIVFGLKYLLLVILAGLVAPSMWTTSYYRCQNCQIYCMNTAVVIMLLVVLDQQGQ